MNTEGSQNQVEMLGVPSCCLTCMVHNDDLEKVKDYLDSYGVSDSQAMFMARCLLRKAVSNAYGQPQGLTNFLLDRGIEANSESESSSEMPLYWNGSVLRHTVEANNIQIMGSLLQWRRSSNWFNDPRTLDYLDLLRMAVALDNTGIGQVLLDHIYQNKSLSCRIDATNNLETVKSLLHRNSDINDKSRNSSTPLDMAIQLAKQEIYKIIWNPRYFNETPLYAAAASGDIIIMKNLLQKNADVEERSYDDMTPLHLAAQLGHTLCTEILVEHGADTNSLCTAALGKMLYNAVLNSQDEVLESLLRKGVDINTKIKHGPSTLHIAIMRGNNEVNKLLNKSSDIDVQDTNNKTILDLIFELGNIRLIEVILKIRSDPGSLLGKTQNRILKDLVRYGFGVDSEDAKGRNLFHSAIRNGCLTIVEYLLNSGTFDVTSKAQNGATPLHTAVTYMHVESARLLVKNHADVNARDGNGRTPLHVLDTYFKCTYINRFKHKHRRNHFDFATFDECKELVELLLEHKADLNSVDKERETPLHSAVRHRNDVIVKILLDKGATVNAKRNHGLTALHLAGKHGTRKIIELLLDHDADINLLSDDEKTPLDYANWDRADDLRSRIIKMITLNQWVCERNLQAINLLDPSSPLTWDRRRPDCCKHEVESMKQEKIGVSNVSYYDVLTNSMNRLVLYAKNKNIVRAVDKGRHKRMFPLYSSMFYHRFKNAQERADGLLDSSMESFRFLTGYPLQDITLIMVFDYLSNGDLKNLIKATGATIGTRQTKHEYSPGATCDLESTES